MKLKYQLVVNCALTAVAGLAWLISLMYISVWESRHGLHMFSFFIPKNRVEFIIFGVLGQIATSIIPSVILVFLISFLRPKNLLLYSIAALLPFVLLEIYLILTLSHAVFYAHTVISITIGALVPLALIPILLSLFYRFRRS